MDFAVVYLFNRAVYRGIDFLHHWYVDASRKWAHIFISTLERADRTLALRVTLKYFFHPLYRDYTVLGRVLGMLFRSGRVVIAAAVYLFFLLFFIAFYLIWVLIPVVVIILVFAKIRS